MLQKLQNHLHANLPFLVGKKLLLATSGGLDSMVMADLFHQLDYEIALAHCNFQLRGVESFEDQNFVQDYATQNEIRLFVTQFDTEAFAKDYKLSTQVAARELRYNWFYELLETEKYDYILTAHHADDSLETFLINLSRGTGLEGLDGIPMKNSQVIRPFLAFSRSEILDYAVSHEIQWREDSSNASDKYLRNKIRHDVVPVLKEINPDFLAAFQKTQTYLQEATKMVEDAAIMVYHQVAKDEGDAIHFDLKQLMRLPNYRSYLYQWLNEFGFTSWGDIYDLVEAQSGKQVFSESFRLLKDRGLLIVAPLSHIDRAKEFVIEQNQTEVNFPIKLAFRQVTDISVEENSAIFVDEDQLTFPLVLRRWQEGDSFFPLGMDGKSKKVSKLFKDLKLSLIEKENSWLLCCANQIVWVVGIRQDERFKITNTTQNRLQIALIK
ncbi:tRNA lysidine(34) synthetase TilS [Flavobacterium sp. GT3R68]|uniref:tRNA lysidine(34) synthetase TilS n=1 Tax=Flavobacterium sp. GT3R68 TaxID=2594437 RepID=UPI000F884D06|nr:tRNA lysidine(34) synthetase TilS [Flavobacterium sp. GT3R68]RTY87986.1 tRNA lysidine(34) synthetase TilS [Flavobacterium sp. GSN2]TRW91145.1 tRNA lysidine(34) synthetase TilS [Flavobacterium sp. GT3R68]